MRDDKKTIAQAFEELNQAILRTRDEIEKALLDIARKLSRDDR